VVVCFESGVPHNLLAFAEAGLGSRLICFQNISTNQVRNSMNYTRDEMRTRTTVSTVRVDMNYKFDMFAPPNAVVTKY
jgi:hypothetical protein